MKHSKDNLKYWEGQVERTQYLYKGILKREKFYSFKIMVGGKRERFSLKTSNKTQAAALAKDIYLFFQANGHEATVEKYKKPKKTKIDSPSIGDFLNEVKTCTNLKPNTLYTYEKKFRQLVAACCKINVKGSKVGQGNLELRKKVDKVLLSELTPQKIVSWKKQFLSRAENEEQKRNYQNTFNTIIRNSKSLFSADALVFVAAEFAGKKSIVNRTTTRILKGKLIIPHNPFEDVILEKVPKRKYDAQRVGLDSKKVFINAHDKLKSAEPELFKIFLLAVMAGLRRGEIDWLEWKHIDFNQDVIKVQASDNYHLKSSDSENHVFIDEQTSKTLKSFKEKSSSRYVIERNDRSDQQNQPGSYRCGNLFKKLCAWLRKQGITSQKPIHTLRQEAISMVAEQDGIHAASAFARHSDIRITSQVYVENRRKSVINSKIFFEQEIDNQSKE